MPTLQQKSTRPPSTLHLLVAAVACATAIAFPASGAAAPVSQLSLEPGSYDFGLQPVYNSAHTDFQLRNDGSEEAWVESIEVVGSGAGTFWVGNSDCWGGPVQPGGSCSIDVYFGPSEPVEYAATLRVRSAGADFEAGLGGEGASPRFTSEPNPVDFGSAKVGSEGATREIEVVNAGNWPGGMFIAVISGGAVASYQLLDENCTGRLIAPAEACTAQVRFRPVSEGVKRATLSLFGESDGGSQIVLTGVGAAPDPAPEPATPPAGASAAVSVPVAAGGAAAAERRAEARRARERRLSVRRARARRLRARRTRARHTLERRRRAQQRRLRQGRSR
jgi:HYDIN/CFA65/VesB-like, Ig-like domain